MGNLKWMDKAMAGFINWSFYNGKWLGRFRSKLFISSWLVKLWNTSQFTCLNFY